MQFDANLAPARAKAVPGQADSSITGEIDLYDELLAFVEMSPEEQRLYLTNTESDPESVNEEPQAPQPSRPAPVEPETADRVDADSTPLDEDIEVTQPVAESFDTSDPLVDLNLDGALAALPPGRECLACGARSAADDLFCMNCGSFINGVASNSPANPFCADCNQGITIDEIFCPWCGSVLAGS